MNYTSTRRQDSCVNFETVVLSGLSPDNGLFLPCCIPLISLVEIEEMRKCSFEDIFYCVVRRFISEDEVENKSLRKIIVKSFSKFRSSEITPCVKINECWILELFHGPTFAFKDIALQFLGNLFEYFLCKDSKSVNSNSITILAATSGDTGSAAIHGMQGKTGINTFVMFPLNKVTKVQELQMTTVINPHVHCISILGDFDDAQAIVKSAFSDVVFRESVKLGAVNSINWARILAQITYYFYSWLRVTDNQATTHESAKRLVSFAVPTGNFGDILAGYYAKRMGLPVDKLVICTNKNDVLHRFLQTGVYRKIPAVESLAPSMDISISSNFERYLFYLSGEDSTVLSQWMTEFETTGEFKISSDLLLRAREDFLSHSSSDEKILSTTAAVYQSSSYLVCPHTATAVAAVKDFNLDPDSTVVLATAHPIKFEDAVKKALPDLTQTKPLDIERLTTLSVRSILLPNDVEVIKSFVKYHTNPV